MEHLANDMNNNYNNLEGLNGWIQGMEAEQQHWKDEAQREKERKEEEEYWRKKHLVDNLDHMKNYMREQWTEKVDAAKKSYG